ncbi:hypothetical protein [Streptomyces sp. NPDC013171]|uniref:hypothetical protein n=1 Tax=Streptomyces sp. NPDC013171 TaxID=3364863 RepID=UPI0036A690AD
MHAAFSVLTCASMLGAYAALGRLAPAPRRIAPALALALALGFIAGCALALAFT